MAALPGGRAGAPEDVEELIGAEGDHVQKWPVGHPGRDTEKRREDGRVKRPLQMTHSVGLPEKLERELELAGGGGGAGDGTGGGTRRV